MMVARKLPFIDIRSSEADITSGRTFEGGEVTLNGLFFDWRAGVPNVWHGPAGPMMLGTWGDRGHGVLVLLSSGALPCPVCRVLGGFHDDEVHDDKRRVPVDKLLPSGDSKRAQVRLSDDEIAERREAARQRREGRA